MAPAYASLFMEKFEKDFLESSDVQPFLLFRFLDDIFMILDDSEENLLNFFDKLNKFLETIKFTYSYSKTNAVFLDVNCSSLKKVLCILVCLKKILMCISLLNSHPVILFHAKKVSHLAKQNDIDL